MSTPTSNSKRRRIPGAGENSPHGERPEPERTSVSQESGGERGLASLHRKFTAQLATPQLNYKVLMVVTACLTILGLVMVLSSSMVTSYASGSSVFGEFIKQAVVVFLGLVAMWVALRMRPETIRKYSPLLLGVAIVMLIMVLIPGVGIGGEEVGSNSWIRIGPVGVQPSEVAKLALAVWGAATVSYKARATQRLNSGLGAFLIVSAAIVALVFLQKDLGMAFSVCIVVAALIFFAGVSRRAITSVLGSVAVLGVFSITRQSFRGDRIKTWKDALTLNFSESTTQGAAYHSHQGILSLSDGGMFGVGLGQSRAKWFYLPEAKNDFIFAIVGEELGLLGAFFVVFLFGMLGWFGIRTALAQKDPFLRLLAATLTIGISVQAFFNMGYVVGLLPVTGIQLPLISAGGSSAIITLLSMGLLCNCARNEPETVSSMQHEGRPLIDRILMLPEPQGYKAGEQRRNERRETAYSYGEPVTRQRASAGRGSQDVRRERDRVEQSIRRVGGESRLRGYDGVRRQDLPPTATPKPIPRSRHRADEAGPPRARKTRRTIDNRHRRR
ncbi:putative lipid II flippase FtsW [Corynebacterium evansiae]|uniref:Probable peptidoglycan glycosyltransferase FtsW n=1 Tax=Corynebacterium evansiae TaxID=2913499 RepID=A0A9X3LPV8_9CORY|nr:putative lipid II flippase FtsW [Corynebacterium evansiae]MCZ9290018.1 putative lipid II flippase FtsW [Corynebacterium evansiae]